MTAQEVVNRALQKLGVIRPGQTPATEESDDGLLALQNMINSWNAQLIPINEVTVTTETMASGSPYTLTTRPLKIKSAVYANAGVEVPFDVVTAEEWGNAKRNLIVFHDGGYPSSTLRVRPDPSAGTMTLFIYDSLAIPGALSTTLDYPPGYNHAIITNLAIQLASEYGFRDDGLLVPLMQDAKLSIQGLNGNVLGAPLPAPVDETMPNATRAALGARQ
jgi:hypothetical protein